MEGLGQRGAGLPDGPRPLATARRPDNIPIINLAPYTVYINADQWDGFRSERAEILDALSKANVENLLVFTGDIHSFYAAELHVDFDAPGTKPSASST